MSVLTRFKARTPDVAQLEAARDGEGLVRALHHRKADVRAEAAKALIWIARPADIGALLEAAEDDDDRVRWGADLAVLKLAQRDCRALADPATADLLARAVVGSRYPAGNLPQALSIVAGAVRDYAPTTVGAETIELLIEGLDDVYLSSEAQSAVAEALACLGGPRAFGPLLARFEHEVAANTFPDVRPLGVLGDPRAARPLLKSYHRQAKIQPGVDWIQSYAEAFSSLDSRAPAEASIPLEARVVGAVWGFRWERAVELGKPTLGELHRLLAEWEHVRKWGGHGHLAGAIRALGEIGDPSSAPPITEIFTRNSGPDTASWGSGGFPEVDEARATVASTLGRLPGQDAVEGLVRCFRRAPGGDLGKQPFAEAIVARARSAGLVADESAIPPLLELLATTDEYDDPPRWSGRKARMLAHDALLAYGEAAEPALRTMLQATGDPDVRLEAESTLEALAV